MALSEARETLAILHVAQAAGYVREIDELVLRQLNPIIGTLVNVVR